MGMMITTELRQGKMDDMQGLLLPSTAASAANFSQRLSHAAVNPHQLYAYDSSEGDTGQPSKSMEEQNSLQSFPQPASSTDSTTTASPAESAPQSDSAAESTHKPDVQSLHKPDSELSTVTDAACTPRLWQGPTQQAALASVIHATASPPTHVMGSSPRMASAASIEHVHEQGTATLEDEDTQPFRGALSVQPRVLRHKKAAHAVTPRGQQVQHGFLVGKQQWGSLQLPQRIIAHDLSSSSEPSQPSIRSQHSMPPWSHGPAARHVTQRSRGTHGQAANAGRVATRSARKLLDNRTADSAQSNSFSGNPKQGSGVHSASRHTELLSESDDGSESETNLPEATPQRTRRGNSAGQLPQQLPEQVLGQSIRQLARQPTQPGASQQTSRQTSKQLLQLSSGHLSHETPQQAGMQSPTTEETRSPGSTPSQIQGELSTFNLVCDYCI